MKMIRKILSYVLVAALASAVSFAIAAQNRPQATVPGKVEQLESLIQERFIGEVDTVAMEDAAARAMVDSLGDQWSHYMSAKEFTDYKEQMNNAYVGIGITILAEEGKEGFEIIRVEPNGPAQEAGLQMGDILTGAEGIDFKGKTSSEAGAIIKGEEGTTVRVNVLRNGRTMEFTVERRQIQVQVARGEMLTGDTGLVTIVNFDSRCSDETLAAIESLLDQGAEKIIFDVRNNPGGYKDELVKILDYLLPEGPLFRSESYTGKITVDESDSDCLDIPMAVLVNGNSYSAAEFFAAALSEYDAAVVVGTQTSGKGYYQNTFELKDGSAVGLSVGKYSTPNGVNLAGVGITPDVVVEVDEETFAMIYNSLLPATEDPQITAALEALGK